MLKLYLLKEDETKLIASLMKWYWEEVAYEDIEDSSG
jgi:hypothetical protein